VAVISSHQPSTPFNWSNLRSFLRQSFRINPQLTIVGILMLFTFAGTLLGLIVDHRVITGVPAWVKPAKFAISLGIYSFTILWLLSFIQGHRRLVSLVTNATALFVIVEMVIITTQVIRGTTSHFNFSTPLDATLFQVMGTGAVLAWIMGAIVAILLLIQRMTDTAFAWSLRLGILLSLVGMAIAFLMTQPTTLQLAALHAGQPMKIVGAHSVGVADGGPGLPFLGWSTVGGDLRIPHFIGLHALQVLPFIGWFLSRRRFANLRTGHRVALIWTFGLSYLSLITLLTWQALRAQSIIAPDALTLQALAAIISATALAVIAIATHARMHAKVKVNNKHFKWP
jgi:hypothetical protein